jgi:predicted RNase H-like nuclease
MLEVYPHAAHVVLFSLPRIMAYKAKPGRTALSLSENLAIYRRHLRLALAECGLSGLGLAVDPASPPRGRARKRHEDELDAVTCALAAMEAWRHGLSPDEVIGDPGTGYIAVPGLARDPRFAQR